MAAIYRTDEVGCLPLQQLDGVAGAMCRSAFVLKDKRVACDTFDCWKHLPRQQDIAITLAVHIHLRVDIGQTSVQSL